MFQENTSEITGKSTSSMSPTILLTKYPQVLFLADHDHVFKVFSIFLTFLGS